MNSLQYFECICVANPNILLLNTCTVYLCIVGLRGLHNNVDIKIVIIYKKRKNIHLSLLLMGFYSIVIKPSRSMDDFYTGVMYAKSRCIEGGNHEVSKNYF